MKHFSNNKLQKTVYFKNEFIVLINFDMIISISYYLLTWFYPRLLMIQFTFKLILTQMTDDHFYIMMNLKIIIY